MINSSHHHLGYARIRQKKYAESIPYFHKVIELDEHYAYAYDHLGLALIMNGEPMEQSYQKALLPSERQLIGSMQQGGIMVQTCLLGSCHTRKPCLHGLQRKPNPTADT